MKQFPKQRLSSPYLGFLAIVSATTVLTLGAGTAQAAVCSVPTVSYPTIQSAVNDPNCNPINVGPGPYPENVTIGRTLTLNGAQAGSPVAGRTFGSPMESTVAGLIKVQAANVT